MFVATGAAPVADKEAIVDDGFHDDEDINDDPKAAEIEIEVLP